MRILILFLLILTTAACQSTTAKKTHTSQNAEVGSLLPAIYFDDNESLIKDTSTITHNAKWMKANPNKVVLLEGHCDERGDDEYNLYLGDMRARAVMKALMDLGVPEKQLVLVSYGKKKPAIKSWTQDGLAKNRRVEFTLR